MNEVAWHVVVKMVGEDVGPRAANRLVNGIDEAKGAIGTTLWIDALEVS
jgi:hypothetical protein